MIYEIGDRYVKAIYTYIHIYGATKPLRILPKFVTDYLVLAEKNYQTYAHALARRKKDSSLGFPNTIGYYSITETSEVETMSELIKSYHPA